MNIFDEALKSLDEAIEYERGNKIKGRAVSRELKPVAPPKAYTGKDIKRIREQNNYTQAYLGELLGVTWKCVQKWEYDESKPNKSACRVISLVEKGEDFLKQADIIR